MQLPSIDRNQLHQNQVGPIASFTGTFHCAFRRRQVEIQVSTDGLAADQHCEAVAECRGGNRIRRYDGNRSAAQSIA